MEQMTMVTVRMPNNLAQKLDDLARITERSRGAVIRLLISQATNSPIGGISTGSGGQPVDRACPNASVQAGRKMEVQQ